MMRAVQNYALMFYPNEAVTVIKTINMTGLKVASQAPLTFIGVTYIGSMFFGY